MRSTTVRNLLIVVVSIAVGFVIVRSLPAEALLAVGEWFDSIRHVPIGVVTGLTLALLVQNRRLERRVRALEDRGEQASQDASI